MIIAIEKNLERGIKLLNSITDEQYSDASIPPYFSSIGCNMRHVLDAFRCILEGIDTGEIDFTNRVRNSICEMKTENGIEYFNDIILKLRSLDTLDLDRIIPVVDNLGAGVIKVNYTLESAFTYAHSHAIHHFASIGFLVHQLEIELEDADFGYNPTTPKRKGLTV